MARNKNKHTWQLGYMQREPPPRGQKIEKKDRAIIKTFHSKHECPGDSQKCKLCETSPSVVSLESLAKDAGNTGSGEYCGAGSNCAGEKSCGACEQKPRFVAIDYSR